MFITTVIKCHSLSYVVFNAKITLFDLTLPFPLTLAHNKSLKQCHLCIKKYITERMTFNDSCHKNALKTPSYS